MNYLVLSFRFLSRNKRYLLHLPRSFYFNLKYLPFKQAIRIPVFISNRVRFIKLKGSLRIENELSSGMIKIGFPSTVDIFDHKHHRGAWQNEGAVIFKGKANIGQGCRILVKPKGELTFGEYFWATAEDTFWCNKKISFGNMVVLAFHILCMDTDSHNIRSVLTNEIINEDKPILIGNNVWIGYGATVLKGTEINDHSIIGARSVVSKTFSLKNIIIAGSPGKVVKEDITWDTD